MSKKNCDIQALLEGSPLFSGVESVDLEGSVISPLKDGESISGVGISHSLNIVIKGKGLVYSGDRENSKLLMRILRKGDIFGVADLFSEEKSVPVSRIVASGEFSIISFSREKVAELINSSERFRMNYISFLSDRIMFLNRKIECLTAGSAEGKLAFWIMSSLQEGERELTLPTTLSSLALQLNLGRASLYRAFETLENDNVILRKGKSLILLTDKDITKIYNY